MLELINGCTTQLRTNIVIMIKINKYKLINDNNEDEWKKIYKTNYTLINLVIVWLLWEASLFLFRLTVYCVNQPFMNVEWMTERTSSSHVTMVQSVRKLLIPEIRYW